MLANTNAVLSTVNSPKPKDFICKFLKQTQATNLHILEAGNGDCVKQKLPK